MTVVENFEIDCKIANAVANAFLKYQDGKFDYDTFKDLTLDLYSIKPNFIYDFVKDWIESNRTNQLENQSSGSMYTSIVDIDNLMAEYDTDNMSDETYEELQRIYMNEVNH